ncbi:MAG: M23 family metallopeptidase [Chloroflexi bacterium]|nr:M23 family metallopeptidase [Chloroflexota bacterium]MCY4246809.1 M23 family metallopeptidase [Chloroflexota bacterium]
MRRRSSFATGPARVNPYARAGSLPRWRRGCGCIGLLAAFALMIAAAFLVITAPEAASAPPTTQTGAVTASLQPATRIAAPASDLPPGGPAAALPTINARQITSLLATPPLQQSESLLMPDERLRYDPFTIIPNRSRTKMIVYVARQGDTIAAIAGRYGLSSETIAWCNDHRLAQWLRPGDAVNIPPVDGACHTVLRTQGLDIAAIAEKYGIDDPYAIIQTPANGLAAVTPDFLAPSNTFLFIPGGEGSVITWNAPVEQDSAGNVVAFDPGSPFSCGARSGGGAYWSNPLPNGTFVRGFYAGHSGIDIAAPTGTPIYAANSGPVLYAGWNNWGYGNTVVIGHGPYSTLYGHMSSRNVGCGQTVAVGQIIGFVGSTGNSSGPHLHFEIRYLNQPADPSATTGIGW